MAQIKTIDLLHECSGSIHSLAKKAGVNVFQTDIYNKIIKDEKVAHAVSVLSGALMLATEKITGVKIETV